MTLIWALAWIFSGKPEVSFNSDYQDPKLWAVWLVVAVGLDFSDRSPW